MALETFDFVGKNFVTSITDNRKEPSEEAYVFLHGFPGGQNANIDLARSIHSLENQDVHLFHYEGINGSKGEFSFSSAVGGADGFVKYLLTHRQYCKVNMVGHSWGGFVALAIAPLFKGVLNNLVLLAPFTNIPSTAILQSVLTDLLKDRHDLDYVSLEKSILEFEDFKSKKFPLTSLESDHNFIKNILVIQGRLDEEISHKDTRLLVDNISSKCTYIELNENHQFSDRNRLIYNVETWLKNL